MMAGNGGDDSGGPEGGRYPMARPFVLKPAGITADEARALVDGVIARYGLDPAQCATERNWRQFALGDAVIRVGVADWRGSDEQHLITYSRVLDLPPASPPAAFLRLLLELNHDRTLAARFTIRDNSVFVSATRPIAGLDEEEVEYAIRSVMSVAGGTAAPLKEALRQMALEAPLPLAELPQVRATPKEMEALAGFLGPCEPHARAFYRSVIELWHRAGFTTRVSGGSVRLQIPAAKRARSLASLGPVHPDGRHLVVLPWERLHHEQAFQASAVARFQALAQGIGSLTRTKSTAHMCVTADFTDDEAARLVLALVALAKAFQPEHAAVAHQMAPRHVDKTVEACPPEVATVYRLLVDGWLKAGGTVRCPRPGRIYLKLRTAAHAGGTVSAVAHEFGLAVLAAPRAERPPAIGVAWGLSGSGAFAYLDAMPRQVAEFEASVAGLPGFRRKGSAAQIVMTPSFGRTHAEALLEAMVRLTAAEASLA